MRVTSRQVISRGLRRQCPNCGGPLTFGPKMQLPARCPQCGARWDRGNGFFLGAMVWNYGVTVFGLLPFVVMAGIFGWVPVWAAITLGLILAAIFPWLFYKWSWGLWLASYYAVLPNELPANFGEDHPLLHK